jgi:transposase
MKKKYLNRQVILQRLNQPGSPSISVISEESGIPKATLYAWLSSDRRDSKHSSSQGNLLMTKRSKPRSPSIKFALLGECHGLQGAALQTFCEQKGVTVSELLSWRDLALSGIELADRDGLGVTRKEHDAEMVSLKEDLRRKNDALAEAAALLILQKKTSEILGGQKWQRISDKK